MGTGVVTLRFDKVNNDESRHLAPTYIASVPGKNPIVAAVAPWLPSGHPRQPVVQHTIGAEELLAPGGEQVGGVSVGRVESGPVVGPQLPP
jgi:hypothetical protein